MGRARRPARAGHGARAVGNAKNDAFLARMRADGVEPFADTRAFIERLRAAGVRTAVISASKNCAEILEVAGVADLFEVRVDGLDAQALGLPGKPDPAIFLEAARRLGVEPTRTAIVEDAVSGVAAGRRGGFALVIGVDRVGHPEALAADADVVVADLHELIVTEEHTIERDEHPRSPLPSLPSASTTTRAPPARGSGAGRVPRLRRHPHADRRPSRSRPCSPTPLERSSSRWRLEPRSASSAAATSTTCARWSAATRRRLWYAGSHGFDIASPEGWRRGNIEAGLVRLPRRRRGGAAGPCRRGARGLGRAQALRHRRAPPPDPRGGRAPPGGDRDPGGGRRRRPACGGRKEDLRAATIVREKGRALHHILDAAGIDPAANLAVYVGDDVTDEDAFDAIRGSGVGVVVGTEDRETAARHRLDDTDQVRDLLQLLLDHIEATP